jgi:uncharacterized protein (DUF2141 family)
MLMTKNFEKQSKIIKGYIMRRRMRMMIFCMVAASAYVEISASSSYRVAGSISFTKKGNILLQLVDKNSFEKAGRDAGGNKQLSMKIEVGSQELQAKKVSFAFDGVPAGRYAIRAFQDVNGNGILDSGAMGPTEPWGFYKPSRPVFRSPRFDEVAFNLDADITDANFELK